MHYALAAAFPGDPAFRASSAYGANGVIPTPFEGDSSGIPESVMF
jgi:hypothetical protein